MLHPSRGPAVEKSFSFLPSVFSLRLLHYDCLGAFAWETERATDCDSNPLTLLLYTVERGCNARLKEQS
jgi:hypothetical protein